MFLGQGNHSSIDEVDFRLPLLEDIDAHGSLVLLSAGDHLLQDVVSLLSGDVNSLSSSHSQSLSHQKIANDSGPRSLKHLTKAQISEGGHGADSQVVEQLAPDLFPDLKTLLAGKVVSCEELTKLGHSCACLAVHLSNPGWQIGVRPDMPGALNVGSLGGEAAEDSSLAHHLFNKLLVAKAVLEGDEDGFLVEHVACALDC